MLSSLRRCDEPQLPNIHQLSCRSGTLGLLDEMDIDRVDGLRGSDSPSAAAPGLVLARAGFSNRTSFIAITNTIIGRAASVAVILSILITSTYALIIPSLSRVPLPKLIAYSKSL
jgi:hypothetical protein